MNICVLGMWHLGAVISAGLAKLGHQVIGIDKNAENVKALNQAKLPVFEPGLQTLTETLLKSGSLKFKTPSQSLRESTQVLWVAIDTPVGEDDVADVESVMEEIKPWLWSMPPDSLIISSSQLPVGSIQRLKQFTETEFPEKMLRFASVPENLRLGSALEVFLKPDRIVVGCDDRKTKTQVSEILSSVDTRIIWMSVASAEMTKHAINSFLATSISFANEIATICEHVGADAREVSIGLKSDQRIGERAYLSPGASFSGGTLARDIDFLLGASKTKFHPIQLSATKQSNDAHKNWSKKKLASLYPNLRGRKIMVWGMTYKPFTDTLRRSSSVDLCKWLVAQEAVVTVYDPMVKELPIDWAENLTISRDCAVANEQEVLIIMTPWPEFQEHTFEVEARRHSTLHVIDSTGCLNEEMTPKILKIYRVGTPV